MKRNPATIRRDASVASAAQLMAERDVGFLPVVDEHGLLAGVLTDRDIVVRACASSVPLTDLRVSLVMSSGATTCGPDEPLEAAESRMRVHRLTSMAIVEAGKPVGVLSLSDISQYAEPATTGRTFRAVAERKYGPERP